MPELAWPTETSCRPSRILVVEDEPVTAEVFERTLRHVGHRVRVARDGLQALHALQEQVPDVVILDLGLPTVSGVDVVRRLRGGVGPQVPILVVSGTARAQVTLAIDDLLPGLWLCKPIRPRELVAAVELVLRDRGAAG
ncbi:MAG: response regulator transcription factor [Planctomycetes bacterium]|nr:response regulator transcription factor [Planctomycetota bacterium]